MSTEKDLEYARRAIQATLKLADFLADAASCGAGFHENWGERVLQAVEPLRNVKNFADQTLAHNEMLLNSNSKFMRRTEKAEKELLDYKRSRKNLVLIKRSTLHRIMQWMSQDEGNCEPETANRIDAEITKALLKREGDI